MKTSLISLKIGPPVKIENGMNNLLPRDDSVEVVPLVDNLKVPHFVL
jgi:hypothetical protein